MELSAHLRDVRLSKKLSQGKVASKVGIRQDTVSSFELQPGTSRLETFFRILSALELELEVKPKGSDTVSRSDS
ncbi:transcriptional regulator [Pantoea sp. BRM17]|nr:transcriptional regulator [Pantoea sp. BRM17]